MSEGLEKKAVIDRALELDLVRVTEAAAINSAKWIGRGDKNAADQAAVTGMREMFETVDIDGIVVIGEGEKDEAPMLYIGEQIGARGADSVRVDIAVDPLDGTTSTSKGTANAISVIAVAPKGNLYHTKNFYMEKIAVGPDAKGCIDIEKPLKENLVNVANAIGKDITELTVTFLERERHDEMIAQCRELGCRVKLFKDGDVGAAIATCFADSDVDVLYGIGGAPEGVLAAAALKCLGGDMQGRLYPKTEEEKEQAENDKDYYKVLTIDDLAGGDDVLFIATGVTDGDMVDGVHFLAGNKISTETVIMRSVTGTLRYVKAVHDMEKKPMTGIIL